MKQIPKIEKHILAMAEHKYGCAIVRQQLMRAGFWAGAIGALALLSPGSARSADPARAPEAAAKVESARRWQAKMQELYQTLAGLTADVTSDARFEARANRGRIDSSARKLMDLAHDLTRKGMAAPDSDPSIKLLAGAFQEQTRMAYIALKQGNRDYARGLLSGISGYCIACHTRNSAGPSFGSLPLAPDTRATGLTDQGRFFAATRQFDRAFAAFSQVVSDPVAPVTRSLDWTRSLRYALAIAVRVKRDPDVALALVDQVLAAKNAPFFVKQDAKLWRASIELWKKELPRRIESEEGLYLEAQRLTAAAREAQKYPSDRSADVIYLRASAVLHELLQTAPEGRYTNQALLLAGVCYEVLAPASLEDLHELYYEACVKRASGTPIADACYQRYEQSVYLGYTGSAGTDLPAEVRQKLERLRTTAIAPATPAPPR
jgi:hypothetical protein